MTIGAEQLSLCLNVKDHHVASVSLTSSRAPMAARLLEGKSPDEAAAIIPLVFSLCATAQHQAALTSIEEALGYDLSPAHQGARKILLNGEGISEHITRILFDWPLLAKIIPDNETVRNIRVLPSTFKSLIFKDGQNDKAGGAPLDVNHADLLSHFGALHAACELSVFGMAAEAFLQLKNLEDFKEWLSNTKTVPAQCLQKWNNASELENTWAEVPFLDHISKSHFADLLDASNSESFVAAPTIEGTVCETGPFQRMQNHELIKALGNCTLSRLVARLLDLAHMLVELEPLLDRLSDEGNLFHTKALHKGTSVIEAVRGKLVHRLWLDEENQKITRYRILAPTEWNFHPSGLLASSLIGMKGTSNAMLEEQARLAVMALDPCVGCDIVIKDL